MLQYILQLYRAPAKNCWKHCWLAKKWLYGDNTKKHQGLLIYPRVTGDMPTKIRKEHCLQQTWLQYATAENTSILYKNACISARWSTSLDAHHILHTGTWLRGEHSDKCCSISCNYIMLHATNWWNHRRLVKKNDSTATILTITRSY